MADIEYSGQQKSIFNYFAKQQVFTDVALSNVNVDGNVVVRARAGTGKTTTIIKAIEYAPEDKILLAAFNKSIAEELKTKLKNPKAEAKTLHSVGFGFLRTNWQGCKLDGERADRLARKACGPAAGDAVVKLVRELAAKGKSAAPFPNQDQMVELAYQHDLDPDEYLEEEGWNVARIADLAMRAMELACEKDTPKFTTIDFDDMVFVPLRNGWIRPRYDLVVIDEAQDMNASQLMLAMKVCRKNGRVVVVGDDRQAIYGFRGADSNSIDRLKGELVASELGLTITYRCPKRVVAAAQRIVPDYTAADTAPEGEVLDLNYEKMVELAEPGDFVLSRKNAPLAKVCLRFIRMNKKAMVKGREIGSGLVSVIRKIKGKSIPNFLEKLTTWEEKQVDRLKATGKKSAEDKIAFVQDQAETLRALCESPLATGLPALEALVLNMFSETTGGEKDFIVCSSVHKSKGLERDRVFLLKETLYPGGRASIEEQNIEYVGVTRAKKSLVWVTGIG